MYFMITTYINLYISKHADDPLNDILVGTPIPDEILPVHNGAHFMTLDKIVSEFNSNDVIGKPEGE